MSILFLDDTIDFGPDDLDRLPLDGPQRALAHLATALADVGQTVIVRCRGNRSGQYGAVQWQGLDAGDIPEDVTVAVAVADPALFARIWPTGLPSGVTPVLWRFAASPAVSSVPNMIVLDSRAGAFGADGAQAFAPGVADVFAPPVSEGADHAPVAVTTTHPDLGLAELVDLWCGHIASKRPAARLHVYSMGLSGSGASGPLAERIRTANAGIEIRAPLGERGMADVYRQARVHLFPEQAADGACQALRESQACGVPALVTGPSGGAGHLIRAGESGYVAPDRAAVQALLLLMLGETPPLLGGVPEADVVRWPDAARLFLALVDIQPTGK